MEEIVNSLGSLVRAITEFFSYIAPGYYALIIVLFIVTLPYVLFKMVQKMIENVETS